MANPDPIITSLVAQATAQGLRVQASSTHAVCVDTNYPSVRVKLWARDAGYEIEVATMFAGRDVLNLPPAEASMMLADRLIEVITKLSSMHMGNG